MSLKTLVDGVYCDASRFKDLEKMEQCNICFGRGYIPKARDPYSRNPHGFYARTCYGCHGAGIRPPLAPSGRRWPIRRGKDGTYTSTR